jgi:hypothetical protein
MVQICVRNNARKEHGRNWWVDEEVTCPRRSCSVSTSMHLKLASSFMLYLCPSFYNHQSMRGHSLVMFLPATGSLHVERVIFGSWCWRRFHKTPCLLSPPIGDSWCSPIKDVEQQHMCTSSRFVLSMKILHRCLLCITLVRQSADQRHRSSLGWVARWPDHLT